MTLSSRDLCAIATVQPKLDAAVAMLAALKEIKRTIEAADGERYSDSLRAREATHRLAREAIAQAEAAGIKEER